MDYNLKTAIAKNGEGLKKLRQAFESNNNDAITAALEELDNGQKMLADHANRSPTAETQTDAAKTDPAKAGGTAQRQQPQEGRRDTTK